MRAKPKLKAEAVKIVLSAYEKRLQAYVYVIVKAVSIFSGLKAVSDAFVYRE